ncbi:MAG: hypothetical protein KIT80_23665 [Chitinophagaceae bacterium]|nr:hypothetical protein [Nitrosomonas sp.]MCW5929939.1 hypothetical protein [Chitinophagaceae bacterium]
MNDKEIRLIGLTGEAGSGKDTVGQILLNDHGYAIDSFKANLISPLAEIFDVDSSIFCDRKLKEEPSASLFGKSPREVMQSFGTDWGRNMIHPDIWVKHTKMNIRRLLDKNLKVVVTDVRYNNEAEMIRDLGGEIWKIDRPNNPFKIDTSHCSENGIADDYIDLTIKNHSDIDKLKRMILIALGKDNATECLNTPNL